ncbi:MAG: AlkA N-terminal domain-containing protein [Nannocystales bacterium]
MRAWGACWRRKNDQVRKRPAPPTCDCYRYSIELGHDICYRALRTRDVRFDGRFFTGVTSTGVYCRPICPARTPKPENCVFFVCAAAAEDAGFRACRRCRPDTAPGTPAWRGTSSTVSRALRLIGDGALDEAGVEALAERLGVGDRYLRRLFQEHLGASPQAIATTRRVHFAKHLIEHTELPMSQVALTAGFRNVRRFNAAVRKCFDRTPTEIRKRAPGSRGGRGPLTVLLPVKQPFDWDDMLGWMTSRLTPGVEQIAGRTYRRSIELSGDVGVIEVSPSRRTEASLSLSVAGELAPHLAAIAGRVRRQFDLDTDAPAIAEQLGRDPLLAQVAAEMPGTRVPGCWDRFELAVRAIVGQQVTVVGATRLFGRIVKRFGRPLPRAAEGGPTHLFPQPHELMDADVASIGMPKARANTIRRLARAVADGDDVLALAPDLDTAVRRLRALPGIGDWTAQYIAMRGLSEPDAFPAGDLGLRKAVRGCEDKLPTPVQVRRRAEAWQPWRAYAAMMLWRQGTAAQGEQQ